MFVTDGVERIIIMAQYGFDDDSIQWVAIT